MSENKNDKAREEIFQTYDILNEIEQHGVYEISAKVISPIREARLMTKFDHIGDLPKIFSDNKLSILPINRGTYVIGHFKTHKEISYSDIRIQNIEPRTDLESIDKSNLFSESIAINYALATGMLGDLIDERCEPTISGRMSSSSFSFKVIDQVSETQKVIDVNNAQVEIDGGFESDSKLMIIEAKMGKWDDFIVRQLYYPYRLWKQKVSKEVIPVFMTVSNDVFTFFVYKFNDDNDYNSIELVKTKSYAISYEAIIFDEIKDILKNVKTVPEPDDTPFPQADDFEKVINLLEILQSGEKTDDELAEKYNFVIRQSHYYKNAAKYLGYATFEHGGPLKLTEKGEKLMSKSRRDRILSLINEVLSHPAFNLSFKKFIETAGDIKRGDIVGIMKQCNLKDVNSEITYHRRASTIRGWCEWIMNITEESE